MTIYLHQGDLPSDHPTGPIVAIDSETMGLQVGRDRLCLVQLSWGDGHAHLVKFAPPAPGTAGQGIAAPNLAALLGDPNTLKLFHFGRFDIAVMANALGVMASPVYCTKIASKLVRTYTDRHGLKELCREMLGVDLSKAQQSSDWGCPTLTEDQKSYAASDVLHLHALKAKLDVMLAREGRTKLHADCCAFLPARAELDLRGWPQDIFEH